jgi:hypothetical protein
MSVNYKKYDVECSLQYHQNLVTWLHSKLSYTLHGSVYILLLSCLPAPAIKRYCIIFFWEANKTILILPISAQNKTKTKQIRYQIPQKQGIRPGVPNGSASPDPCPINDTQS